MAENIESFHIKSEKNLMFFVGSSACDHFLSPNIGKCPNGYYCRDCVDQHSTRSDPMVGTRYYMRSRGTAQSVVYGYDWVVLLQTPISMGPEAADLEIVADSVILSVMDREPNSITPWQLWNPQHDSWYQERRFRKSQTQDSLLEPSATRLHSRFASVERVFPSSQSTERSFADTESMFGSPLSTQPSAVPMQRQHAFRVIHDVDDGHMYIEQLNENDETAQMSAP